MPTNITTKVNGPLLRFPFLPDLGGGANPFLLPGPRTTPDRFFRSSFQKFKDGLGLEETDAHKQTLLQNIGNELSELHKNLRSLPLADIYKYLLGDEDLYVEMLHRAFTDGNMTATSIQYQIEERFLKEFEKLLLGYGPPSGLIFDALNAIGSPTGNNETNRRLIFDQVADLGGRLPLQNALETIQAVFYDVVKDAPAQALVARYLTLRIDLSRFHGGKQNLIKEEMSAYLNQLGLLALRNPLPNSQEGSDELIEENDEFFGASYLHAIGVAEGTRDPLTTVFNPDNDVELNYDVDFFDSFEEQGIDLESIAAAAKLYYVYELGDNLGIFNSVNELIIAWAQLRLRLRDSALFKVYNYYKKMEDRLTVEERAMIYKQVFNLGDAQVLNYSIVNEGFAILLNRLFNVILTFKEKKETVENGLRQVSKEPVFQALRDMQYNLTHHMVGKPMIDVHELYAQLEDCIEILRDSEIVKQVTGGHFNNMWDTLVYLQGFSQGQRAISSLPVSAHRTKAVEGWRVIAFMTNFDYNLRHTVSDDQFMELVNSTEAWILAQAQLEEVSSSRLPPPDNGQMNYTNPEEGDFADWE